MIEIVSGPDLSTPAEAVEYLEKLQRILEYLEISDCKMAEGSLRCDANISLKPIDREELGTKTELKNLNSFKALSRALDYEIKRQSELLAAGQAVRAETRKWDEAKQQTLSIRSKEETQDYRYFPEPDLVPIELDPAYIAGIAKSLPELPDEKKQRFMADYGLPEYDADLITSAKRLAEFFEAVNAWYFNPKAASNFIMGELLRLLGEEQLKSAEIPVNPASFGDLLKLIDEGRSASPLGSRSLHRCFGPVPRRRRLSKPKVLSKYPMKPSCLR